MMKDIEQQIQSKLDDLQQQKGCRLLLAVESGSRAWGYASTTSDYDVRCIYYYPQERYLSIRPPRDTVEWELNEVFDITGWELRKALGLTLKSNLTVYEWADSPIVYRSSPWLPEFRQLIRRVVQPGLLASRYLGMAASTIHRYLEREEVPYKQYFYALRPLLAARWVLQERKPAPVPFADLRHLLPDEMQEVTDELLSMIDVLVEGRFVLAQKDISLKFRGSRNQRIVDMNKTREAGEIILWDEGKRGM